MKTLADGCKRFLFTENKKNFLMMCNISGQAQAQVMQ